ncbi:MAG: DNA repair protein RecO [Balneolales bacterium]|nr:DNA repair protein RecO [Balneolales bacterium]
MLTESPCIVLKSVDFKESSKIVTLFCKEYGKTAVLVRGFKKKNSRYAGIMRFGSVLETQFYYKESRSVQTIKDAEIRLSTLKIESDFPKMALSMAFLELVGQLIQEGEPNAELFDFCERFLGWLNDFEGEATPLFPYLQLRIASIMGFSIMDDADGLHELEPNEIVRQIGLQTFYFNIVSGSVSPNPDSELSFRLSLQQALYLKLALSEKKARLLTYPFAKAELKKLIYHLDVYLKHHIEGIRDRKSDAVFEQIL